MFHCSTCKSAQKKAAVPPPILRTKQLWCDKMLPALQNKPPTTPQTNAAHNIWFCTPAPELRNFARSEEEEHIPPRSAFEWNKNPFILSESKDSLLLSVVPPGPPVEQPSVRTLKFSLVWKVGGVWLALPAPRRRVRIITSKWLVIHNGRQSVASLEILPAATQRSGII